MASHTKTLKVAHPGKYNATQAQMSAALRSELDEGVKLSGKPSFDVKSNRAGYSSEVVASYETEDEKPKTESKPGK